MNLLIENVQRILRESGTIGSPRDWPLKAEVIRNGRKAFLFNQAKPSKGQIYIISEDGDLYVYEDGDMEFVMTDDEGVEHSVSLAQIKEAQDIYENADINCMGWRFSGLVIEGSKLLFEFMDDDSMLYRPRVLVDVKNKTTEYIPDGDDDDIF